MNLTFNATAKSENITKTVVKTNGFTIIIDEPERLGGTNDGANPVEYLLAAFAGCLNVVGNLVAREMGFTLNGLEINLEGDLDPSKFMGQPSDNRAGYKAIRVNLNPDTDADEATLKRWLEVIEDRCPVSDTLSHGTVVQLGIS